MIKNIIKIMAHILFVGIVLYSIRLLVLSDFLTVPMKVGGAEELYITRYVPYILAILSYLYLKKKRLALITVAFFLFFLLGRYMEIFLTFEEYVGKYKFSLDAKPKLQIPTTSYESKLNKNSVYREIKPLIKKGMPRKEVYKILNKKEIKYHIDKNRNIDITGQGITIEIDKENKVYRFNAYL